MRGLLCALLCLLVAACVFSGPNDLAPDQIEALGPLLKGERP